MHGGVKAMALHINNNLHLRAFVRTPPGGPESGRLLPPWFYSSEAWLRWGWKCPRMALCWFSLMLEPSVAVKQSAIEFAHSGRTLNRKEGSGHSFWSYCPATRLKQSNSSVAIAGCLQTCFFFCPVVGTGEGGRDGSLCFSFIFDSVWWHVYLLILRYPFSYKTVKGESEWVRINFGSGVVIYWAFSMDVLWKWEEVSIYVTNKFWHMSLFLVCVCVFLIFIYLFWLCQVLVVACGL